MYLASGEYPILSALVGDREPMAAFQEFLEMMVDKGRFDRGLTIILDGFAAKYRLPGRAGVPADRQLRDAKRQARRPRRGAR